MIFNQVALLFFFFFSLSSLFANLKIDVASTSALLIDETNGKVLFSKNASQTMYPASCTKLAFALYAIRFHQDLFDKTIVCSYDAVKMMPESQKSKNNFANVPSYILETDATHMGLKAGEEMLFYDLLEATMIISADDASNVIAEAMGKGSIEKCVDEVNRLMASIGCKNTHFTNPHGLHHPDHVSTAEDLAHLCRVAMKEPLLKEIVKKAYFLRPATNLQEAVSLRPTNRLLVKSSPYYYPPVIGVKTGYHRRAGCCLIAQAEKNGRSLVSVTLQASSAERFQDTKKLFETAFQESQVKQMLIVAGPQPFSYKIEGGNQALTTYSKEAISHTYYPSEDPKMVVRPLWNQITLPVKKGKLVGELVLYVDNELVQKKQLYAGNDVKASLAFRLKQHLNLILIGGIGCIVFLIVFLVKRSSINSTH